MTDGIMKLQHPGPSPAQSFWATLFKGGRKIELVFDDKKTITILHNNGGAPIDLMCPSTDGKVLWCSLEDGKEIFFETATGEPLTIANGSKKTKGAVYRPEFYN